MLKPDGSIYPLRPPEDDPRFNFGLTSDVSKVLEAAGYPPIKSGADFVRLQQALFGFIYAAAEVTQ